MSPGPVAGLGKSSRISQVIVGILTKPFVYIGMGAALLFSAVFLLSPLIYMLMESFQQPITSATPNTFTWDNYKEFLTNSFYPLIFLRTVRVAALSSILMLVCGYPIAYLLRVASPRNRSRLLLFVISPLLVSVVVRTYGWVIILGKEGMFNSLILALGMDVPFSHRTHLYHEATVIVGVAHVFIPLMILAIYNSLQKFSFSLLRAASNLGAPPYRVFFEVTLPLSMPGVVAGLSTVFPLAMGSFITVAVLGGPSVWVISMSAYQEAMTLLNWQFAGAIGIALLLSVTIFVALFALLLSRLVHAQVRS
jgi:putative spermidine/putrescine transport system permease protein